MLIASRKIYTVICEFHSCLFLTHGHIGRTENIENLPTITTKGLAHDNFLSKGPLIGGTMQKITNIYEIDIKDKNCKIVCNSMESYEIFDAQNLLFEYN